MSLFNWFFKDKQHLDNKILTELEPGVPTILSFKSSTNLKVYTNDGQKCIGIETRWGLVYAEVGDRVRFWRKPNTDDIWVYLSGTVDGSGLLGIGKYHALLEILEKNWHYEASIVTINLDSLSVEVTYYRSVYSTIKKDEMIETLKRKFNPKNKSWILTFSFLNDEFLSEMPILRCNNLEVSLENIEKLQENIWLVNSKGEKISDVNYSSRDAIIKTLRSHYSGYFIALEYSSRESDRFHFIVALNQ